MSLLQSPSSVWTAASVCVAPSLRAGATSAGRAKTPAGAAASSLRAVSSLHDEASSLRAERGRTFFFTRGRRAPAGAPLPEARTFLAAAPWGAGSRAEGRGPRWGDGSDGRGSRPGREWSRRRWPCSCRSPLRFRPAPRSARPALGDGSTMEAELRAPQRRAPPRHRHRPDPATCH